MLQTVEILVLSVFWSLKHWNCIFVHVSLSWFLWSNSYRSSGDLFLINLMLCPALKPSRIITIGGVPKEKKGDTLHSFISCRNNKSFSDIEGWKLVFFSQTSHSFAVLIFKQEGRFSAFQCCVISIGYVIRCNFLFIASERWILVWHFYCCTCPDLWVIQLRPLGNFTFLWIDQLALWAKWTPSLDYFSCLITEHHSFIALTDIRATWWFYIYRVGVLLSVWWLQVVVQRLPQQKK